MNGYVIWNLGLFLFNLTVFVLMASTGNKAAWPVVIAVFVTLAAAATSYKRKK